MKQRGDAGNIATGPLASDGHQVKSSSNRSFGLVFAVVFGVVALWPLISGEAIRYWAAAISVAFVFAALAFPASLGIANRCWTRLGLLLGHIVSPVALALVYYSTIVPLGLVMRLLGKDPLSLRLDRAATSYWVERVPKARPDESMKNQF